MREQTLLASNGYKWQETLERQHHELQILFDISSALHSSPRLEDVLNQAILAILKTLKLKMGAIYLFENRQEPNRLTLAAHHGFTPELIESIRSFSLSPQQIKRLRTCDRVVWFPSEKIVFPGLRELMEAESIEEIIGIALVTPKALVGTLYVTNHGALQVGPERREFLTTIGQQIGVAVENARLLDFVQRAKKELEISFDAIQHSIFLIDEHYQILLFNRTSSEIYGGGTDNLTGRYYYEVLYRTSSPPDDCPVRQCMERGVSIQKEGPHPTWGGFFRRYAFPVFNLAGQVERVVYYEKDVTEARKQEDRLRLSERLKALGTLAAGIAHEIRNPLATISFNAQLLARELNLNESQKQMLGDLVREVKKIDEIVKQVLHFARPKDPQFLPHHLNDIVRYCYSLAKVHTRKRNIDFILDLADDLPSLIVDHNQIAQVIMNLIINAVEAMPNGGSLVVRSRWDPKRSCVELIVSDTGPGISPEDRNRIFDPFFTRKPDGTGLGLSISRQILERHNAYLELDTTSSDGTTFRIIFPVAKA